MVQNHPTRLTKTQPNRVFELFRELQRRFMSKLAKKVALVTGGSRGIGAAIAKRLGADGASVAITYAKDASAASAVVAPSRPDLCPTRPPREPSKCLPRHYPERSGAGA